MSWSVGSDDRYNLQSPVPETKRFKGAYFQTETLEPSAQVRECLSRDRTSRLSIAFGCNGPKPSIIFPQRTQIAAGARGSR